MSWGAERTAARDTLLARVAAAADGVRIPVVLIDGPSGAGKSTLADLLVACWPGGETVRLIRMDDLYPGWGGLDAASAGLSETLLGPLARTGRGRWRRWDWAAGEPGEWQSVEGPGPVVVEGCGTLARRSVPWAHLRLWLDADDALRKERALDRDGETFVTHWDGWQRDFERYLAREDPRAAADLRLDVTGWPLFFSCHPPAGTTVAP
ncbi:ATP-binding protein [Leifsonia xyli subsp. xyli]|uniref:Uncharacterized protein n=2 Tax=Leifsonia xyli subsp. xyli TaxID=59736 RepID=Q6AEF9_LEIXX|nr:hypothetical protein [Leifsonia xyli]AAT89237.1 conserved hypothetical protein [Leifsonia xyli subsp. xyli str. CTCB07]ODA90887.1 ATP-binding protein [Leifsonia xyli subsp. xyli]